MSTWRSETMIVAIIILIATSNAQAAMVRGQVRTPNGNPNANVTVSVERTSLNGEITFQASTITDANGQFFMNVPGSGMYNVVAHKKGWENAESIVMASDSQSAKGDVIVMQLTPLYMLLTNLQFGSTIYVVLFGLLVLAFNFYWAPEPSRGVQLFGWVIVAIGIGISFYRTGWRFGVPIGFLGTLAGLLIQRFGRKIASDRLWQESRERSDQDAIEQQLKDEITALVGMEAVTVTDLKAFGTVLIDGKIIQARAQRGFISQDVRVVVKSIDGRHPVVEPCESH